MIKFWEEERVTLFSLLYCCRDVCQELEDAWSQLEAFSTSKGKREKQRQRKSNAVFKDTLISNIYFHFFLKGVKLEQAYNGQQFDRAVKDVELWLDEVETQLSMEELGKVRKI